MKYVLLLVLNILLISCNRIDKSIEREMKNLAYQSIVISENMQVIIKEEDTIINNFFNSRIKMVVYTDSTSCNGCALNKLDMWNDFIEYAKQFDGALKYYFIFSPPKGENIRVPLRNSMLDYPVLLDSLGEFERLNPHLPKNKAMHTFLLDENNNVILVGNPLYNKEIEKMFYEEVEKRLGKPQSKKETSKD